MRLTRTELGAVALTCAAVDDLTACCLLALVAGIAQAMPGQIAVVLAVSLGFIAVVVGIVRPLMLRWVERAGDAEPTRSQVGITIVGGLLAAAATEAIGIHAPFGAFLFGQSFHTAADWRAQ